MDGVAPHHLLFESPVMTRSRQPRHFHLFFVLPLACASGQLLAQASSGEAAQSGDEQVMQAVKITGTRAEGFVPKTTEAGSFRGSDIMDVPSTVNVVTREVLELQAAAGLYDAVR